MAGSTTWTFTQLAGALTVLSLDGWSAPFGRARKEALVEDGIEIRKAEVYYPGVETGPTRHIFGRRYPARELHGRFRDRYGGTGYAKAKVVACKAFVAAQQPVRIAWSDQLSEVGFVDSFTAGRESEGEIAWKLTYSCDSDDYDNKPSLVPAITLPMDFATAILADAQPVLGPPLAVPGMQGSIFDTLSDLLNVVGDLLTDLYNVVSGIDDFLDASFSVLRRVLTMTAQIRGNVLAIEEFFAAQGVDGLLFTTDAASSVALWQAQTACDIAVMQWLADVSGLERQVQIALSGRPSSMVVAQQGDTWESISTRSYGSPDRAGDLCAANGNVQSPVPGTGYQVPQ